MEILGVIIVGFIVGLIARFLKPGRDSMGFIMTTLVGIAGALLAAFLGRAMGMYSLNEPAGFLGALAGAVLVLFIVQATFGRRHTP